MNNNERDPRTHDIIGAGFEVHTEVGSGFGEGVCRDAFAVEPGLQLGLLLNFGLPSLEYRRFVLSEPRREGGKSA